MSEIGILQNDPNRGLRDRLGAEDEATMTAQDSLTLVLTDLHEAARSRLAADGEPHGRRRRHRRHHEFLHRADTSTDAHANSRPIRSY